MPRKCGNTLALLLMMLMLGRPLVLDLPKSHDVSGQIIATSHDLAPNGGLVGKMSLFQENLGW